jgi:hypothetical protein
VLRLFRGLDRSRAEAVAAHALAIGAFNYRSITSILAKNLDRNQPTLPPTTTILEHSNLRGPTYFN